MSSHSTSATLSEDAPMEQYGKLRSTRKVIELTLPHDSSEDDVAKAVLKSLGKNPASLRAEKQTKNAVALARLWALAEPVQMVIVNGADRIDAKSVAVLRNLLPVGTEVLLRWKADPDKPLTRITDTEPYPGTRLRYIPTPMAAPAPGSQLRPFSELCIPDSSFLTFRYDCRKWLTPAVFAQIDAYYLNAVDELTVFVGLDASLRPSVALASVPAVEEFLNRQLLKCSSDTELQIRAKAIQAAMLHAGFLVEFDSLDFFHQHQVNMAALLHATPLLRTIHQPELASVAMLLILTMGDEVALRRVRIDDDALSFGDAAQLFGRSLTRSLEPFRNNVD